MKKLPLLARSFACRTLEIIDILAHLKQVVLEWQHIEFAFQGAWIASYPRELEASERSWACGFPNQMSAGLYALGRYGFSYPVLLHILIRIWTKLTQNLARSAR